MPICKSAAALRTVPLATTAFASTDDIVLAWLSAGFFLNIQGCITLIDPVLSVDEDEHTSEIGMELAPAPRTALTLAKKGAVFVGAYAVYYRLTQLGVPLAQCRICRYYDPFFRGEVRLDITPCDHPWQLKDLKRGGPPLRAGVRCGYIFNTVKGRLFCPSAARRVRDGMSKACLFLCALDRLIGWAFFL